MTRAAPECVYCGKRISGLFMYCSDVCRIEDAERLSIDDPDAVA